MRALPPRAGGDDVDEYAPIDASGSLTGLSLLFFVAALCARYLVGALPPEALRMLADALPFELRYWRRPFFTAMAVPFFALCGLLFALAGGRRAASRSLARLALFLNGVTLGLGLLAIAVIGWILP